MPQLSPRTVNIMQHHSHEYVTVHSEGDSADVIQVTKQMYLNQGDYLGLSRRAQYNQMSPKKLRAGLEG